MGSHRIQTDRFATGFVNDAQTGQFLQHRQHARSVAASPGNRAQFKRDGDAEIIEKWLSLRGYIVGEERYSRRLERTAQRLAGL
jgi:hypothetical protein